MDIFIYSTTGSILVAEPYTTLMGLCKSKGLRYSTYSQRTFPVVNESFTIVKLPLIKAEMPERVEKIPFDLALAQKIALQHNIPEANILVWKSRGYIPSKYAASEQ